MKKKRKLVTVQVAKHPWFDKKYYFERDVTAAFGTILNSLQKWGGIDAVDANFEETPLRVGKAYGEILEGMFGSDWKVKEILSKTFPAKSEEMIIVAPIRVWSFCPHHFLPVEMKIWLAYIPFMKVLGLSKLARIAELIAKKPALQEDTTVEIARTIQDSLKPKGVACLIKGRHLCMVMRGAKQDAWTTSTSLQGVFLKNPETRAEFLAATRE